LEQLVAAPVPRNAVSTLKETTMNLERTIRKAKIAGLNLAITALTQVKKVLPFVEAEKTRVENEEGTKKIDENWDDTGCI
jgi:methyl coenzyme M reductase subunit C-like uncharacterized protein (methanogenesis marker protein 7)